MFIQMNNARKSYGKGENTVHALDGIELALEQGKIYVILGPSGSGKSTLLNMMGGLDSLDEGSITVDGKEISRLKSGELTKYRKTDVGFVFQFYNLLPDLTVKENIQVVEDIAKDPLPIDEVMKAVDIEKYKDRFPNELSGVSSSELPSPEPSSRIRNFCYVMSLQVPSIQRHREVFLNLWRRSTDSLEQLLQSSPTMRL